MVGNVIGTLLLEPHHSVRTRIQMIYGGKVESNHHIQAAPILLLHGKGASEKAWLPLKPQLKKLNRPIFAIDISKSDDEDQAFIEKKINALWDEYQKPIDLVGHSRGARLS